MYFCGIGAQRAGTTWLWRMLQDHPQVAFSPVKELHYFSWKHLGERAVPFRESARQQLIHTVERFDPIAPSARLSMRVRLLTHWMTMQDDQDYLEYFERIRDYTSKKCVGEITPAYAMLPKAGFENIVALYPDARFLFVMRNPVERLWSNARMGGQPPADVLRFSLLDAVRGRTEYGEAIRGILAVVPRERLHVSFYEELADPLLGAEQMNRVYEFLDLSPHDVSEKAIQNKDGAAPAHDFDAALRRQLAEQFRHVYDFAREFMGRLPESWERDAAAG